MYDNNQVAHAPRGYMLSATVSDEATAGGVGDQCGWRKKLACVSEIQRSAWVGIIGVVSVSPIL